MLIVDWSIFCKMVYVPRVTTISAAIWLFPPTITQHYYLKNNVHHDLNYECPPAKINLHLSGALLAVASSGLWRGAMMLANNVQKYFSNQMQVVNFVKLEMRPIFPVNP